MERDRPEEGLCACWGPDGGYIAARAGSTCLVYESPAVSTPQTTLFYGPSFVNPAVSSDGKRVSALQVTGRFPFGVPIFFLAGL
jgi:hypothetical protein